jgi:hypothetical protein
MILEMTMNRPQYLTHIYLIMDKTLIYGLFENLRVWAAG